MSSGYEISIEFSKVGDAEGSIRLFSDTGLV